MKVLQIVGYKNSGKTTFAKELITYLSTRGVKVGSLKNHGHGGVPLGIEETDSELHRTAGSTIAGVIGEGLLQLSHANHWKVDDMLLIYEMLGTEFLVMEGFKHLSFPKIVLLRKEEDKQLLEKLTNIQGVISSKEIEGENICRATFHYEDRERAIKWIYNSTEKWLF